MNDLKKVYKASTLEQAELGFDNVKEIWESEIPESSLNLGKKIGQSLLHTFPIQLRSEKLFIQQIQWKGFIDS